MPHIDVKPPVKSTDTDIRYQVKYRNEISLHGNLCIFSSYSFNETVEDYVFYYLQAIHQSGFSVAFVSTSKLSDSCIERLSANCFLIIERENKCPDFGSWKIALSLLNLGRDFDNVLLTNDSVFGPFYNLPDIIASMKKKFDIWGMTNSYEIDYHIQSYFLFFNRKVVLSTTWKDFWDKIDISLSKQDVINKYEVGLTKNFEKMFRVGTYAEVDVLSKRLSDGNKYINPTLGFWSILIEKHHFPFFKREILIRPEIDKVYWERNIYVNIGNWRKLISDKTDYPVGHIDSFLNNFAQLMKLKNRDIALQPRKILFLTHNIEIGGAQRVLLNFLNWVKKNKNFPFEIIVCREGQEQWLNEFSSLGLVTFFHKLSQDEKHQLKNRLVNEQIASIFSNTMVNAEVMKFFSFLNTPQIVFVHELSYVLNAFSAIKDNIDWYRKNVSHFVCCADVVRDNLIEFLKVEREKTSVVHEFIEDESPLEDGKKQVVEIRNALKIPQNAFVVGMSGTFEWRKSADLLPIIATSLCHRHEDIHIIWLGTDPAAPMYNEIVSDINKAGLSHKVHLVGKQQVTQPYFHLFDVFLMISREDPFPLVNLESGLAGKPVICFKNSGGSQEYVELGTGASVPYLDISSLIAKVLEYYNERNALKTESGKITSIVKQNFTTQVQAPKLFNVIKKFYDENEMRLTEQPSITLMVHIFFDSTWEEIKTQIKHFDNGKNNFLFSISEACLIKEYIVDDIKKAFRNSYAIITTNVGRDIGGKFALIELYLLLKLQSSYLVFLQVIAAYRRKGFWFINYPIAFVLHLN